MPLIIPSNSISGEFAVDNSARFDDGSSDHLTLTATTPTNNKKQTTSVWVKRSTLSGSTNFGIVAFVDLASPSTSRHHLYFINDTLGAFYADPTITRLDLKTTRLFRDTSAWYHIVLAIDTTLATTSDRAKLWVNGVQETSFSPADYPVQNTTFLDSGETLQVGRLTTSGGSQQYFDGYIAEPVFIDGQALDPTSFGEFDADTGIWKPIDVSGLTFGTNGFYLDFENSGSLGADVSGNGNNFTVNNLTSIDQTTDTPTNNYATMNPLIRFSAGSVTYSNGNLNGSAGAIDMATQTTIGVNSGKWYWEVKWTADSGFDRPGIVPEDQNPDNAPQVDGIAWNRLSTTNGMYMLNSAVSGSWGSAFSTGDIINFALDCDNKALYIGQNGTWRNSGDPTSGASKTGAVDYSGTSLDGKYLFPSFGKGASGTTTWEYNFGNPSFTIASGNSDAKGYGNFEYAVPSGYYALNTKNLAEYG